MSAGARHLRIVRGLARALLVAYPGVFRRTHARDFAEVAEHRWRRERRGVRDRMATWRTARLLLADTMQAAPAHWRRAAAQRSTDHPALGSFRSFKERTMTWIRGLGRDVRFGARLLVRHPGFTASAVLVLALGIGANTAMFSLVNSLLLKPRVGGVDAALVSVHSRDLGHPGTYRAFSFVEYEELAAARDIFASVSGHTYGLVGLRDGETTRRVFAEIITAEFFDTLGVRPVRGRAFTSAETKPGSDLPVAILADSLWRRLGADDAVFANPIVLNGRAFTVVGVAPRGFGGSLAVASPELWIPTGMYESMAFDVVSEGLGAKLADPRHRTLALVARLPHDSSITSVSPGLDVLSRQRAAANPAENRDQAIELAPLSRVSVSTEPPSDGPLSGVAVFLLSFSGVVLLIASFNLANMLLARGRSRRRELAIRLAIGGSRGRLVRQLLTENFLVALLGGAGGLLLSWWTMRLVVQALPASLPLTLTVDLAPDLSVLGATLGFAVLGTVLSGLGPALSLARAEVVRDLKAQPGDGAGANKRQWLRTRDALVTAQLALTMVMLTAAGLFMRGAVEAAGTDPGFTLDRGILVNIDTSLGGYDPSRTRDAQREALVRLRALPGVLSASVSSLMPFSEFSDTREVQRAGPPVPRGDGAAAAGLIEATMSRIGTGYFETLGIPLRHGRDFTAVEEASDKAERIAILDETLAGNLFGTSDAVGQLVQFGIREDGETPVTLRVVGVVAGVRSDVFDAGPRPFVYTPLGQELRTNVYLHVRTTAPSGDAETAMLPFVRQALRAVDPNFPIVTLETRPMFRARNLLVWLVGAGAQVTGVLAAAALIVALVGVYGVKAYLVARRTREIGIRVALGATPSQVVGLVFREGLMLALVGLGIGLILSVAAGQLVRGFLFHGRAFDLPVILVASLALVGTSVLATWLPARRALRIEPTRALRVE